jgi:phospholipid transport system substrate-binding protein
MESLMPTVLNRHVSTATHTARRLGVSLLLLLFAALLSTPHPAAAQSPSAEIRQMLEQRDQQIKRILQGDTENFSPAQREELKTLINGLIDFRAMGQQALGPFWSDLSTEQRDEFVDVFRTIVRAQSMGDLEVYNSEVTYDQIDVSGDSAFVRTVTIYEGQRTPVEYVLKRADGAASSGASDAGTGVDTDWRATDIIVDGVSTAESYARSFRSVVRKRGFETLMESLRKKEQEVTAAS